MFVGLTVAAMSKEKIRALLVAPHESPRIVYIKPTMKSFRKLVDADVIEHGGIEAKKLERNVYAMFNKDRFLVDSLEPNRHIGDDIIVGNIYVVATDDLGIPVSMTDFQVSKYALRFLYPEEFDDIDVAEANINTMCSRFLQNEDW